MRCTLLAFASCLSVASSSIARPSAQRFAPTRRALLGGALAAVGGGQSAGATPALDGYDPSAAVTRPKAGRFFFPPLTPPLFKRATYRYELGRGAWAFEQLLTFANVSATIRTVVVRMEDGGLWVNSPQWPTGELVSLLDELGPVKHVVLPCNALEHAAPVKAFVGKYPEASVWVSPGQYGPFGECGLDKASARNMPYRVDGVLPVGAPKAGDAMPPWASEFEMRTLYVNLPENAGPVSEAAFYHRPTRTLVATDAVVFVPSAPPPIFSTYFDDRSVGEPDFWAKSVLQSVFLPLRNAVGSSPEEQWPGYATVSGRLLRAPILRAFADARAPDAVREWVKDTEAMGAFDRILTAHFASPIKASPADFAAVFAYLDGPMGGSDPVACEDWALLDGLNTLIDSNKLGAPVVYDFKQGCPKS